MDPRIDLYLKDSKRALYVLATRQMISDMDELIVDPMPRDYRAKAEELAQTGRPEAKAKVEEVRQRAVKQKGELVRFLALLESGASLER